MGTASASPKVLPLLSMIHNHDWLLQEYQDLSPNVLAQFKPMLKNLLSPELPVGLAEVVIEPAGQLNFFSLVLLLPYPFHSVNAKATPEKTLCLLNSDSVFLANPTCSDSYSVMKLTFETHLFISPFNLFLWITSLLLIDKVIHSFTYSNISRIIQELWPLS